MTDRPLLDRVAARWVLAAAVLTQIPLLLHLTPEVGLIAAAPLLWQALRLRAPALGRAPHGVILLLLAALATAATIARYGTVFGRTAGLALIAMLLGLKVLESRTTRDAHISIQCCFFLQLGYFLVEQSALTAVSALLSCALAMTALQRVEQPELIGKAALSASLRLLGIAAPLALVLFVLFPRIDTPLWGLPADSAIASTGMSDHMRAGSIADLSLSADIAFRVEFVGSAPPPSERYFRGPVMSLFDGEEWRAAPLGAARTLPQGGRQVDYVMTIESTDKRWLFALDHARPGTNQNLSAENVLLSNSPIRTRVRVPMSSSLDARIGLDLAPATRDANLRLPQGSNPRVAALGARISAEQTDPAARVDAALRVLREGSFVYTLAPPRLGRNSADEFLFDTKRGFCEHFANAFTVLMRSAGVPARVVAGYQGGEINPIDGTMVVRQSDAHAWSEVWLAGRGWVRVDPTAAAAPRRIDGGLAASLPAGEPVPRLVRMDAAWLRALRNRAEAISHAWNTWFLGYNAQRQRDLLAGLGFEPDWRSLTLLLALGAAGWQTAVWIIMFHRRRRLTPAERAWERLLRALERSGISPTPSEGPIAFAARAGTIRPEWRDALDDFAAHYARILYGPAATPSDGVALRQAITAWIARTF